MLIIANCISRVHP